MDSNIAFMHKKIVPWIVASALFMETLDITIINNAIPIIAEHLNEHPLNLKLVLTGYLISLGIFIPLSGYLSDRYGTKEVLLFGIIAFGLGSFLCGISSNLLGLVIARVFQGVGGALMMPVCRLILLKSYPKSEVVSITNYATIPSLLGPAMGPVIGGIIVTYFSWRWIFFVNIPFCCILLYITYSYTQTFKEAKLVKFDFTGFLLFSVALSLAIFAIEAVSERFVGASTALTMISISIMLIILYFYFASMKSDPFINPLLFKSRTFTTTVTGSFFSRLGIGGIPFLIPLILQINHHYSPLKASFYVAFYAIAMICAKFMVKPMLKKIGFRNALFYNTNLIGATVVGFVFLVDNSNPLLIISIIFLNGFFTSIQFSCMNVLSYADLEDNIISRGTSIGSAIQQLSMSFGVAFLVFLLRINNKENDLMSHYSYNTTIYILGIALFLSSLIFLRLNPDAGSKASGHKI